MISSNEITIAGKVTFCRYFEPQGKQYTSMWLRILIEERLSILVDIPINEKEISSKALPAIRNILESDGAWAVVTGQLVNRKDSKSQKMTTRFRVNLRNVEALREDVSPMNFAFMGGDIQKVGQSAFIMGIPYRNIKDNSWKKRNIPIVLPSAGMPEFDSLHRNALTELSKARRAVVYGKVKCKLPNGDDTVNVLASKIIPIP